MAWHEYRNWICPARPAHRPDAFGFANGSGDFAVAAALAERDFLQCLPDGLLKRSSGGQIQRRKSLRHASGENGFERDPGDAMPGANARGRLAGCGPMSGGTGDRKVQLRQTVGRIFRKKLAISRRDAETNKLQTFGRRYGFSQRLKIMYSRPIKITSRKRAKAMKRLRATRFSLRKGRNPWTPPAAR